MTNKQALRVPERKKHNWGQAVMRDCDFCQQWALTVNHNDGGSICASCCDSEYTSSLSSALVAAIERAEAAERCIAELEARTPYGYLRENDGQIQISIGSNRPHNRSGGYATPWFAIYTAAGRIDGEE